MSNQADGAPLELPATPRNLAIVVALRVERACLEGVIAADAAVHVVQSGPGPARAAVAARAAVERGATALMSFGLAGALEPRLRSGDVLLPTRVIAAAGAAPPASVDRGWRDALRGLLAVEFNVVDDTLVSVEQVLAEPQLKAAAACRHAACACDMESAAVGSVATAAGIPFVALRVVADTANDRLPERVDAWIDGAGNSRLAPLLAAAARPAQWRAIWSLMRGFAVARRVLLRLPRRLAAAEFGRPAPTRAW